VLQHEETVEEQRFSAAIRNQERNISALPKASAQRQRSAQNENAGTHQPPLAFDTSELYSFGRVLSIRAKTLSRKSFSSRLYE